MPVNKPKPIKPPKPVTPPKKAKPGNPKLKGMVPNIGMDTAKRKALDLAKRKAVGQRVEPMKKVARFSAKMKNK